MIAALRAVVHNGEILHVVPVVALGEFKVVVKAKVAVYAPGLQNIAGDKAEVVAVFVVNGFCRFLQYAVYVLVGVEVVAAFNAILGIA